MTTYNAIVPQTDDRPTATSIIAAFLDRGDYEITISRKGDQYVATVSVDANDPFGPQAIATSTGADPIAAMTGAMYAAQRTIAGREAAMYAPVDPNVDQDALISEKAGCDEGWAQ